MKNSLIVKVTIERCVFPVKVANGEQPFIENTVLEKNKTIKRRRIKRLDNERLLDLARKGSRNPGTRNVSIIQYDRNEAVVEFAKRIANGCCQLCGKITPFNDIDGSPYLETHHIDWLSKGGSDTIENTVALCPNCHAKMHVVDDEEDKKYLRDLIEKIINEL